MAQDFLTPKRDHITLNISFYISWGETLDKTFMAMMAFSPEHPTTLVTRVGKKSFCTHFAPPHPYTMLTKHFHLTQVCILPFSNIERGNGGVDTYSVDITIIISCFWHFPTQFVQGCRWDQTQNLPLQDDEHLPHPRLLCICFTHD